MIIPGVISTKIFHVIENVTGVLMLLLKYFNQMKTKHSLPDPSGPLSKKVSASIKEAKKEVNANLYS